MKDSDNAKRKITIEDMFAVAKAQKKEMEEDPEGFHKRVYGDSKLWKMLLPCNIENWSSGLIDLSIQQFGTRITSSELDLLVSPTPDDKPDRSYLVPNLAKRLDAEFHNFPNGAFTRLGSRSSKDSFRYRRNNRASNGQEAVEILFGDFSDRVHEDLMLAKYNGSESWVFIRDWIDMPRWTEFRCFMEDRELIGVSQYDYYQVFPEIRERESEILKSIVNYFPTFRDASHLDEVTFDVFLDPETLEPKLLEINPSVYFGVTDPCLLKDKNLEKGKVLFEYNTEIPEWAKRKSKGLII